MKHKIEFDYDEKNGLTIATLRTNKGTFFGTSYKNPDDPLAPSYVTGTNIAECRAWINYCNKQIADKRLELKGLQRLLAAMPEECTNRWYAENLYNAIENEINVIKDQRAGLKKNVFNLIEARRIYLASRSMTKEQKENMKAVIKQSFEDLSKMDKTNKEDK
jgi:hypothetical protein